MANTHPREQQLYETIEKEQIKVPLFIWDLIYHYIGDDITAITHIVTSFCQYNESIDISSAKKILEHTQSIRSTMDKILHPQKIEDQEKIPSLEKIRKKDVQLHPVITELFTHYISNDVYGINMIVCFYLDPMDKNVIPVEDANKILDKLSTIKKFMDRLSLVTNPKIRLSVRDVFPKRKGRK